MKTHFTKKDTQTTDENKRMWTLIAQPNSRTSEPLSQRDGIHTCAKMVVEVLLVKFRNCEQPNVPLT